MPKCKQGNTLLGRLGLLLRQTAMKGSAHLGFSSTFFILNRKCCQERVHLSHFFVSSRILTLCFSMVQGAWGARGLWWNSIAPILECIGPHRSWFSGSSCTCLGPSPLESSNDCCGTYLGPFRGVDLHLDKPSFDKEKTEKELGQIVSSLRFAYKSEFRFGNNLTRLSMENSQNRSSVM